MQRFTIFAICLFLVGSCSIALPASPGIGMVVARGSFQIDNARVTGNATLFDGNVIQTGKAGGEVRMNAGARMQLASDSRGTIYRDRLVLEQGAGTLQGGGYRVQARTLNISSDAPYATGRVALSGQRRVQVAALEGSFRVTNSRGLLVAQVLPGTALELEPPAEGASAASHISGCLRKVSGKFLLTDETTSVTAELRGTGLEAEAGKHVEATGLVDGDAQPVAGATQVIKISSIKRLGKGCSGKAAKGAAGGAAAGGAAGGAAAGGAAAGGAAAGAATVAGVSVTTVAVVGGVAAAATVGGLGVAGSLPGQGDEEAKSSR